METYVIFVYSTYINLGRLNSILDHLSRLESGENLGNIDDSLHDAKLFVVNMFDDHYRDIIHLLTRGYALEGFKTTQKK